MPRRGGRAYRGDMGKRHGERTVEAQLRSAELSLAVVVGLLAGGVFAVATLGQLPVALLAVPVALAASGLTAVVVAAIRRRVLTDD